MKKKSCRILKRFTAAVLAAALVFSDVPSVFAKEAGALEDDFILGSDITEDELKEALREDEELYPEGRFEFFLSQLTAEEGEKQQLVIVRRGGTGKEATVDFKAVDVSAAYGEDYLLTVEESDKVMRILEGEGKPLTDFNDSQMAVQEDETDQEEENVSPADAKGDEAESDGAVSKLQNAKKSKSALNQARDTYLGTDSNSLNWQELDEAHKAQAEAQSEAYQKAFNEFTENILGQEYTFTFKEGEYMKSIYINTIDDDDAESDEQVMFLLGNASVGEVSGSQTAYLNIKDNEEGEKAIFAMATEEMTVDRSEGVARITVNRVSGGNKIASVIVGTGSMEAVSGMDYKAVQKEVLFAQGVMEQTVEIPLLNYEGAPKSAKFQVALDANSAYVQTGAAITTVTLTNSASSVSDGQAAETEGNLSADAAAAWSPSYNVNAYVDVSGARNCLSGKSQVISGLELGLADYIEVTWRSDEGSRSYEVETGGGCSKKKETRTDSNRTSYIYINDVQVMEKGGAFGSRTDRINLSDGQRNTNANLKIAVRTAGENDRATTRVSKITIHYPGYQFTVSNTAYTDAQTGYGNQYTEKIYTDDAGATKTDSSGHRYKEGNTILLGTLQVNNGAGGAYSDTVTLHRTGDKPGFRTTYSTNKNSNGVQVKEGASGNVYLAGYQFQQKNSKSWSKLIAPEDIKLSKSFVNTYTDYIFNGNEFRVRAVYRPYEARVMFQNPDTNRGSYANGFKTNEVLRCTTLDTVQVRGVAKTGYSVSGFSLGVHKDTNLHTSSNSANSLAAKANAYYSQTKTVMEADVKRVSASSYKKTSIDNAVTNKAVGNIVTFSPTGEFVYISPTYSVPTIKVKIDPNNNNKEKGAVIYSEGDSFGSVGGEDVLMGDYRTPMEIKGVTLNQEYTINAVTEDDYKAYFKNFTGDVDENGRITTEEEKAVAAYNFVRTASNGNAYTFRPVLDNSLIFYGFLPTVVNRYAGYIDGIVEIRDKPIFGSKETVKAINGAQISVAGQTTVSQYDGQFGGVKEHGGDGYFSIGSKDFVAGENQTVNITYNNLHLTATQAVNAAGIYELDAYDTFGVNGANAYRVNGTQATPIDVNSISNGDQMYRLVIQTYSKNTTLQAKKAVFRFYRKDGSKIDNAERVVESTNGVFTLDFNPKTMSIPTGASMTVQFEDQNGTAYYEHEMGFSFAQSLGVLSFLSSFNFGGAEKAIEMVGVIDSVFNFGWDGDIDKVAVNSDDNSTKTISLGFSFKKEKDFDGDDEEKPDKKEEIKDAAKNSGTSKEQKANQKKAADDAVDKSGSDNKSSAEVGASASIEVAFGLEINIAKSEDEDHLGEWYFKDMTLAASVEGGVDVTITYMTPIGLPVMIGISAGGSGSATFIIEQNYDKKEYYFSDIMDTDAAKIDIFNFNMNNADRAFDAYGIFTVAPYLDLSAGAGFDLLNLKVGGRADFDMNFYTRADQTNHGDVTFSAYISLKVLFFEKKWTLASTTVNMFGGASGLSALEGSADYTYESLSEMEVDDRSYLERRSGWKGEDLLSAQSVADTSGITERLLEEAVNPNPDIQIAALPNQKYLAVFLDDSPDEDTYNCTHVYYSIGDGETWSKPEMIEKDGTMDDEPAIFDLGEKGIYVAWSSADKVLTKNDTVIDSLNSMNIHGVFFNTTSNTFGEIQEITKTSPYSYTTEDGILMADNTADVKPHISYDEETNRMLMFYTKTEYESTAADDEGLVGDIAKPYSVMAYRVYDFASGSWIETYDAAEEADENYRKAWYGQRFLELAPLALVDEELDGSGFWTKEPEIKAFERAAYQGTDGVTYEQEPIVIESEAATYNGLALYAYVLDYDGDQETPNDRDIFLQIYDYKENQFTHPVMVTTTSDLPESKVKFVRSGSTTLLTYLADNTLYGLDLSYIVQYRLLKSELEGQEFYYIDKSVPPEELKEGDHVYMPPVIVAGDKAADRVSGSTEILDGDDEVMQPAAEELEAAAEENAASIVDYDVDSTDDYIYAVWTQRSTKVKEGIDPTSEEALDADNRVAESQIYIARFDCMEGVVTEPVQVTDEEGANYGAIGFAVESGEAGKVKLLATKAKSTVETVEGEDEAGKVIKKDILTEDMENKDLVAMEFTPVSTLKVQDVKIEELSAGSESYVSMELYNDGVETLENLTLTVEAADGGEIYKDEIVSSVDGVSEDGKTSEKIYGGQKYPVSFPLTLSEDAAGCSFTYKVEDASKKTLAEGSYSEEIPVQLDVTEFEAAQEERGTIHFRVNVVNNGRRKSGASKVQISRKIDGVEEKYKNITSIETDDLLPGESASYTIDYTYGDYDEMFETFITEETESFEALTLFRAYVNENSESAVDEITMQASKEQRLRMTAVRDVSILDGQFKEIGKSYTMKKGDITQLNTSVESIAYKSRYEGTDDADNYDASNITGLKVMYTSDNENVLTVYDSGYVEAVGAGTANVTAYLMPSNNKVVYTAEDGSFEEDNFSTMPEEAMIINHFEVKVSAPDEKKPDLKVDIDSVEVAKTYKVEDDFYQVTKLPSGNEAGEVAVTKADKKTIRTITVKDSVTIGGKQFLITEIGKGAFKNCKKAKKAIIGKNVQKISDNAFYGCKNIKTVTIKSKKISKVGKNSFAKIHKKAVFKVPSAKLKAYKKKFNAKTGFKSTMKIKK